MEVRSTKAHGSPEDRGINSHLDQIRSNREGEQGVSERSEAAREARSRELQAEVDRAAKSREVASKVGEVVRERMLPRPTATDSLELSETGLAAALQGGETTETDESSRAGHVAALKAALEAGELFSRERLERAADRLLGAELEV